MHTFKSYDDLLSRLTWILNENTYIQYIYYHLHHRFCKKMPSWFIRTSTYKIWNVKGSNNNKFTWKNDNNSLSKNQIYNETDTKYANFFVHSSSLIKAKLINRKWLYLVIVEIYFFHSQLFQISSQPSTISSFVTKKRWTLLFGWCYKNDMLFMTSSENNTTKIILALECNMECN